jgi:hypothetical protein
MFPKDSLSIVRKRNEIQGNGPKYLCFKSINFIQAIEIASFPELQAYNPENINDILKVKIDGKDLPITLEWVKNDIEFYHKGKRYDYNYFEQLLKGKFETFVVAIGDVVTLLVKINDDLKPVCEIGNHNFRININLSGFLIDLDIPLELTSENIDILFDPAT